LSTELDRANLRLLKRRQELAADAPAALGDLAARLEERLRSSTEWTCRGCEEAFVGESPEDGLCCRCAIHRQPEPLSRDQALASYGVPARYRQTFIPPDPWPVPIADGADGDMATWSGNPWSTLLIGTHYGAGKSMMAAELLWRLTGGERGAGSWVRAGYVIAALWGKRGEQEQRAAYRLVDAPVLVIDELGRAHVSQAAWETLSDLVGTRYDWQRPTIFTTNVKRDQFKVEEGSLWDRLRDGLIVPVLGPSQRGR
jgi:hypothetical protein